MKTFNQYIIEHSQDIDTYRSNWRGNLGHYNKNYFIKTEEHLSHPDIDNGKIVATRDELIPKSHFVAELPEKKHPDIIWRGMSHDEYKDFKNTGKIKSKGEYNFSNQKGLTYFTTDPKSAESYANSFAPNKHKPTFNKPAYIVGIKRPDEKHIKHVEGTGEHEIGVTRPIEHHEVHKIYRGNVVAYEPEIRDKNGSTTVSARATLHWNKIYEKL